MRSEGAGVSPEQFAELVARYKDENFRDLLTVTWETGCRPQESLRVEARHVDSRAADGFPVIGIQGEENSRVVYLTPAALEITKRLMTNTRPVRSSATQAGSSGRPMRPTADFSMYGARRVSNTRSTRSGILSLSML